MEQSSVTRRLLILLPRSGAAIAKTCVRSCAAVVVVVPLACSRTERAQPPPSVAARPPARTPAPAPSSARPRDPRVCESHFKSIGGYFGFELNSAAVPEFKLEAVRDTARRIRFWGLVVEIEGHADSSETAPGLSLQRAQNMVDLLIQFGVNPKSLTVVDKGVGPAPAKLESNAGVKFRTLSSGCIGEYDK